MKHRPERVSGLLAQKLGELLLKEVETPGALLTITGVEVSKDLNYATVKFSVLPSEKSEEILKLLGRQRSHLQYLLLKKINIKPMPQISFRIDRGPEKAAQVEKALLNQ